MPITGLDDDIRDFALGVLQDASQALLDDLTDLAPVDTGELVDSAYGPEIDAQGLSATIGFDAPQADWTDQGTPPHGEDGNPTMTFFWQDGPNGSGVYTFQHVNHPGQEATHWFSDKVEEWDNYVQDAAQ
jgi:hypothetical protein